MSIQVCLISDIVKIQLVDRKNEIFMPIRITRQTKHLGRQYTNKKGAGVLLKGRKNAFSGSHVFIEHRPPLYVGMS